MSAPARGQADPMSGHVNTDNIETLGRDELGDYLGALAPATLSEVNQALCISLSWSAASAGVPTTTCSTACSRSMW